MRISRVGILAGISTCALAAIASRPSIATPLGITLKDSFTENNQSPYAALTAAGGGIYYGTTSGGFGGLGAVFKFNSVTGSIALKDSFNGTNGASPNAALTAAGGGIYYGTTFSGGIYDGGGIFEFDSNTGFITRTYSFDGSNGANPNAALTAAGGGIYYGTTTRGGAYGYGAIFEFNSNTGSIKLKDSFTVANGAYPSAELTAAGGSIYYGTTTDGGSNGKGAIFEFDSNTGSISLKASFDGTNGTSPNAALTAAGNGIYYGTTIFGGANGSGAVFEFNSNTSFISLKDSFSFVNGTFPYAALTAAGNGIYYGTTTNGGSNGIGTIFEFNSSTGFITPKAGFDRTNGESPYAALTAAGNGIYYGTTYGGGINGRGTVYEFYDGTPVPGPLPLMGAGAAFGWSRRLRRRVQQARPVFPIKV